MNYTYYTKGTCSKQIDLEINGDVITNVKFYGGCDGNVDLKALPVATSWLMQSEKPMRLKKQPMPSRNWSALTECSKPSTH